MGHGKNEQKETQKKMKTDLSRNLRQGSLLYLDGRLAAPKKISEHVAKEPGVYMADYVMDDAGVVKEIRYDRIRI